VFDVEDGEPFEGQLAGNAQRAGRSALVLQLLDQGDDRRGRARRRQRRELGG
jgi:hypothetical protein